MKLTAGEIYFVGERDFKTKELTPYVKIGIVREGAKGPRTSAERLLEHQTGNPRELVLLHVIETPVVEEIETRLHKSLAIHGVSGEWFQLDTDWLEFAHSTALRLRDEANESLLALEQSDLLKKKISNGIKLDANEEAKKWQKIFCISSRIIKQAREVKDKFESLMIESVEDLEEIEHILSKQTRSGATFLNITRLETHHPDIFNKFLESKQTFYQRFNVKDLTWGELEVDQDVNYEFGLMDEFDDMLEYPPHDKTEEDALHERYLQVLAAESEAIWKKQIAEAQLKTICAENDAIVGICYWPRENKEKLIFNQEQFELEHPDLYSAYIEKRDDVEVTIVEPRRGY